METHDGSVEESIFDLETKFTTSTLVIQQKLLNQLTTNAPAFVDHAEYVDRIVDVLFSSLIHFGDKKIKQNTDTIVRTYSKHSSSFAKLVISRIQKIVQRYTKLGSPFANPHDQRTIFQLFAWNTIVLDGITTSSSPSLALFQEQIDNNSTFFQALATQQIWLSSAISVVAASKHLKLISIFKHLKNAVSHCPEIIQQYFQYFGQVTEFTLEHATVLGAVFNIAHSLSSHPTKKAQKIDSSLVKGKFVEWYMKSVLNSTIKVSAPIHELFVPLLMQVNLDEFKTVLLPCISRVIKRNPEVVLETVAFCFKHLSIDLAPFGVELAQVLQTPLLSTNESTKRDAKLALAALLAHIVDTDTLSKIQQCFIKALKDKPPSWQERVALCSALELFHFSAQPKLVENSITVVSEQVDSENNDEGRSNELQILGRIMNKALDLKDLQVDKAFNTIIKNAQSDKDGIRLSALEAAVLSVRQRVSSNETFKYRVDEQRLQKYRGIVQHLTKVIKTSKADGILALQLMEILSADTTLSGELLKPQSLLVTSFNNDSFLFKNTFISKLREQDMKDLASLLVSILANSKLSAILAKTDLSNFIATLVSLTVGSISVRKPAIEEIKASAAFGSFFPHLVNAFFKHLGQINNSNVDKTSSHILREAVTTLVRPLTKESLSYKTQNNNNDAQDTVVILARLLLVLHHPAVQGLENKNALFSLECMQKVNENAVISENFPKLVEHILTYLHPENGFFADGCVNVFRSFARTRSSQQLLSSAVPIICSNLEKIMQELNGLSPTEIGVFNTPAGQLFMKDLKASTAAASNVQVSREKHRRGERGLYSVEDQKWEQQMRQELEQKKKKENEAAEAQAKEEQLKKEAVIRDSVAQKITKFHNTIQVLNGMTDANSNALHKFLPTLSEVAWNLLCASKSGHGLAMESIYGLLQHLSLCIRPVQLAQFAELRLRIAWCLVHIHHYYHFLHRYTTTVTDKTNLKEKEIHKDETDFVAAAVQETISSLHKAAKSHGWSATTETFSIYFHILEFCIVNAHLTSCIITNTPIPAALPPNPVVLAADTLDEAISLIEDHIKPPPSFPTSPKLISLLIYLVSQYAKYKQRASVALLQLLPQLLVSSEAAEFSIEETTCLDSLLKGFFDSSSDVRLACISALAQIPAFVKASDNMPLNEHMATSIWFSSFDANTEVSTIAKQLWQSYEKASQKSNTASLPETFVDTLRHHLADTDSQIQKITAAAITEGLKLHSKKLQETVDTLFALYNQSHPSASDKKASITEAPENVKVRIGIAFCLGSLANHPNCDTQMITKIFDFLVHTSLFDVNDDARQAMVQCGLDIINAKGTSESPAILVLLEKYLSSPSGNTHEHDRVRESLVIFLGSVAKHLPQDSNSGGKTLDILNRLVQTLKTPSESVQRAVCTCLIPLMTVPVIQAQSEALVNQMLDMLQTSNVYAERRGAAFGLAGMVKGLGITSLKKYNVITVLQNAIEDKKHSNARQGALFAFECLSAILQRLFEPYVIQILPKLLVCFGDNSADVREATVETARAIMSQLSGHGVKLVLPALLKSLEDRSNWKSKKGSIELLGSMAFCAPKQLSACLPMIVPRLSAVLTDSHEQVQEAAKEALAHIGSVIRNPEIQNHVPLLLQAMDDPDQYTRDALEALIHTNFVHTIDAASLSLIIPILHRGMKERSTETKKKAAQIIGNMYSLTEFKDLEPYADMLVEDLKVVLSDPIPEVRATTAKALGSLIKGMSQQGTNAGPDDVSNTVVPYLLSTMKSEAGSVERSGAAQGLSEILAGLPVQKLEDLLQEIQQNASNPKPHVREGYIGLFVFLPSTMTQTFQNYLKAVLPIVLAGLSDESEAVREVALRAGQAIVNQYAQSALPLLLPTLEEGLFDDNWRIRQSSVQLLGDLLYRVISKAATGTEDDTGAILTQALGTERRNRVLSALYMIRSDVSSVVRQKALLVWKSVVTNTPRTLKEILPSMMRALIDCLGSENMDKRQVAGKTLGDLVEKLGDKILPEIIPILENGLESPEAHTRQGVCIGLSEVMSTTAKAQLVMYADVLIPAVRRALVDPLPEVREAAGQAFDTLYKNIGNKAIDEIVPRLLIQLQSAETPEIMNSSLDAIREIMAVRSNVVLPLLLPKLLSPPVTVSNIRALASVADVAGGAINYHLSDLIPPLVNALAETHSSTLASELATDIRNSAETILLAVQSEGVHLLFTELVKELESEDLLIRTEAVYLIGAFCAKTKIQFESEANLLLESLLLRFNDSERQVQQAAWQALGNLTEALRKESLPNYIPFVRGVLAKLRPTPTAQVLGFGLPKGLAPILPMFLNGLMLGSPTIREEAAYGLGDLISLTPEDVLKPFLIQITGPLIRIIGDRFPHTVKAAILQTLNLLISKGGPLLRPFVPQLQTTFVKALNDTNRIVRVHAATALGLLMTLTTKVDPLVNELLNGVSSSDDGVQESMLSALQQVLLKVTNQLSAETLDKVIDALQNLLADDQELIRTLSSKVVGAYVRAVTAQNPESSRVDSLLHDVLLVEKNFSASWQLRHGFCSALTAVLKHAPKQYIQKYDQTIVSHVLRFAGDDKVPVRQVAGETIGRLLSNSDLLKSGELTQILSVLGQLIGDSSNDVKLTALKETKRFAKAFPSVAVQNLAVLVPPIMVCLKDRTNFPVKLASERALVHLLQIHTNPSILQQFTQTQDTTSAKNLLDYTTRVLSKLAPKSDAEDENSD